jgi:hypothetical protein
MFAIAIVDAMKSAIIFILLMALVGAAAFTKPSEDDFKRFVTARSTQADSNIIKAGWDQFQADEFVKSCTFNNRILWMSVQQNGQTIYTGAFSHWFNRAEVAKRMKTVKDDVNVAKDKIESIKIETKK